MVRLVLGIAVGYVLEARAGRERYEQMERLSAQAADNPAVQGLAGFVQAKVSAVLPKCPEYCQAAGGTSPGGRIRPISMRPISIRPGCNGGRLPKPNRTRKSPMRYSAVRPAEGRSAGIGSGSAAPVVDPMVTIWFSLRSRSRPEDTAITASSSASIPSLVVATTRSMPSWTSARSSRR